MADKELEVAVRAYVKTMMRRYVPLFAIGVVLAVLVLEAPSTAQKPTAASAAELVGAPAAASATDAPPAGSTTPSGASAPSAAVASNASTSAPVAPSGPVGSAAVGPAGSSGALGQASTSAPGKTGSGKPVAAKQMAVNGTVCGPGIRQFDSPYAPPCVAAWSGNNGGSTAPGVTGTTITVSERRFTDNSTVVAAGQLFPGALPSADALQADTQAFVDYLNKQYELYGRKVVVKPFQPKGNLIDELVGQDQQGAATDAQTAKGLGAFADVTVINSQLYQQSLVGQKIISSNTFYPDQSFMQSSLPYAYTTPFPTGQQAGAGLGSMACKALVPFPTSYAGGSLNGKPRVFGIIYQNSPGGKGADQQIAQQLQGCGSKVAATASYTDDLSSLPQQSAQIASQMSAAGVTTVIVANFDPLIDLYLTPAFDNASYYPEWLETEWYPVFERSSPSDQSGHVVAIFPWGALPAPKDTEAYQFYLRATGGQSPQEPYVTTLFYELELLFNGLQAAGPTLTPQTFQRGLQSLPPSGDGQVGVWKYGSGVYAPPTTFKVAQWSPSTKDPFDGGQGAFLPCYGSASFAYTDPKTFPSGRLQCQGK